MNIEGVKIVEANIALSVKPNPTVHHAANVP
jgi:hypothetical protein